MADLNSDIIWFDKPLSNKVELVGGKNASLGEMIQNLVKTDINVPMGFATSTKMYREFLEHNELSPLIQNAISRFENNEISLSECGKEIRSHFLKSNWPEQSKDNIVAAYHAFSQSTESQNIAVAVRSSATAEDLPDASFAGQQETFLNVQGEHALLEACQKCYASLFTDRAITYRNIHHYDHLSVALSIGIQEMVRSDIGSSGVMFTLDTETGFPKVISIGATWGLGENIVQGVVDPDEFCIFKPLLTNKDLVPIIDKHLGSKKIKMVYGETATQATKNITTTIQEQQTYSIEDNDALTLARWACLIEKHYGCPMDMEWAKDGTDGQLYIVQARPETVKSQETNNSLKTYKILSRNECLLKGLAIGQNIVSAPICIIEDIKDIDNFIEGSILVTKNTDPDWVPLMKRSAAIVTDHGGRTSHAAIVSRELGLPAIIGTENATSILENNQTITVSCAEGDIGFVYKGEAQYSETNIDLTQIQKTKTKIMLNLANPATAFQWWRLKADGVGLVRMEFVINNHLKVHPMALIKFNELQPGNEKQAIEKLTHQYKDKAQYFVENLALGLARFAALVYPNPTVIRMSDFKTNEYAHLLGGQSFEEIEANPMIGFRGASRYYSPHYQQAFALECQAINTIRKKMGFTNVIVMIPFCRTIDEAKKVLAVMAENGLVKGEEQLQIYMMCEIPSNVILAQDFAKVFDGFSIGSNDLTQLTLGIDRDSEQLSTLFNEQDKAVKWMIAKAIRESHLENTRIGLCGQAPSDYPQFSDFLVECGIDSISVSPDSYFNVKQCVSKKERAL